jgi:hypothetical protein
MGFAALEGQPQGLPLSQKIFLTQHLVKGFGPQRLGQWGRWTFMKKVVGHGHIFTAFYPPVKSMLLLLYKGIISAIL